MLVTLKVEVDRPDQFLVILSEVKVWVMQNFNPGEWKRPDEHHLTVAVRPHIPMKDIGMDPCAKPMDLFDVTLEVAK